MAEPALTTTEAAKLASVAPSTIKRWADRGLLPSSRTAGGHRRIERSALEHLLRRLRKPAGDLDPLLESWVRCLVRGDPHDIDGRLLQRRSRLGAWHRVAEEVGDVLRMIGDWWRGGQLGIADEHVASESLARALARVGAMLPRVTVGPICLLATAGEDEHTLGLALAELCLREQRWSPRWLGRRTPPCEIIESVETQHTSMVALSASLASNDAQLLGRLVEQIGATCAEHNVHLVLGGAGAWPTHPAYGSRIASLAAFHDYLERIDPVQPC